MRNRGAKSNTTIYKGDGITSQDYSSTRQGTTNDRPYDLGLGGMSHGNNPTHAAPGGGGVHPQYQQPKRQQRHHYQSQFPSHQNYQHQQQQQQQQQQQHHHHRQFISQQQQQQQQQHSYPYQHENTGHRQQQMHPSTNANQKQFTNPNMQHQQPQQTKQDFAVSGDGRRQIDLLDFVGDTNLSNLDQFLHETRSTVNTRNMVMDETYRPKSAGQKSIPPSTPVSNASPSVNGSLEKIHNLKPTRSIMSRKVTLGDGSSNMNSNTTEIDAGGTGGGAGGDDSDQNTSKTKGQRKKFDASSFPK